MSSKPIVLMYHGIVSDSVVLPPEREVGADIYDVPLAEFEKHLELIEKSGMKACEIADIDATKVVITFDDGEENNCLNALPVLSRFKYPAYFFIITRRVGRDGYMSMDQLKQMIDAGMIIGSHGISHEILTNLKDTQIEEELGASRRFLERNLGVEIKDLSIPRGFCNDKILNMAYAAGYQNVFISDRPRDLKNQQCHSRIAVKQNWDVGRFEMAIHGQVPVKEAVVERTKNMTKFVLREGGYNWLRSLYIKMFK